MTLSYMPSNTDSIMDVLFPEFRNTEIWNITTVEVILEEEFSLDLPQ